MENYRKRKNKKSPEETGVQEKLKAYLEDYKVKCDQILRRVEFQQRLLNYQLLLAGLVATIGIRLLTGTESTIANNPNAILSSTTAHYFLLLSPLPFFFLSWSFSNHDIFIVSIARYINQIIRPRVRDLLKGEDILRFEDFLSNERKLRAKHFGILPVLGEEYLLPLLFPVILLSTYFVLFIEDDVCNFWVNKKNIARTVPLALFIVDMVFLLLTARLKIKVGKNYLRILNP